MKQSINQLIKTKQIYMHLKMVIIVDLLACLVHLINN